MVKRLFGFHDVKLGRPSLRVGVGSAPIEIERPKPAESVGPPAKLFAVSVPLRGGTPHLFQYDNDEDGKRELANLVRGENVIAVVLGHRVPLESTNVVEFRIHGDTEINRVPLPDR